MKIFLLLISLLGTSIWGYRNLPSPANVGDKARPDDSAVLQITSTTKGFLGPRMTTEQRDDIVSPATGLLIYNTDTLAYETFGGTVWSSVGGADHPLWTTGTDFEIGAVVIDGSTFKVYRANTAHTSGATLTGDIALGYWDELSDDLNKEPSATDNALVVWDGTDGDNVKNSALISSGGSNENLTTVGDIEADTLIGTTDIQTGNITISGNTVESTDASGDLLLDTNAGEVRVLDDLIAEGNFTVNGTTTTINSTTLAVTDQQITVNNGGNQASANANDAGLEVEMSDATNAGLYYDSTFTSLFGIGEFNDFREIVTVDQAQDVTGKTLLEVDNLQLNGNTVASTSGNTIISADGAGGLVQIDETNAEFIGDKFEFRPDSVNNGLYLDVNNLNAIWKRGDNDANILSLSGATTVGYSAWRWTQSQGTKTTPVLQFGDATTGVNYEFNALNGGISGMYFIADSVQALNVFEDEVDVPTLPFRVGEIDIGETANQIESNTGDLTIASADEILMPDNVKANYVMAGDSSAGTAVEASAIFEAKSTTKGSIPFPKMDESEREAIASPAEGLTVFNTDTNQANIYSNGAWVPLGSGSGGGLDVFYTEQFELGTDETDFSCGNNATFLGGGTVDGTLDIEETTVIKGDKSLEFTAGATQANTEDDYCASPIITLASKEGDGGKTIGFNMWYTYDGSDDEVTIVIYDDTNDVVISSSSDYLKASADPIRFSTSFYVPDGVTQLRWGFHYKTAPAVASNVIRFDEVQLTLRPFDYKDLVEEHVVTYSGFTSRDGGNLVLFSTEQENSDGGLITVTNSGQTRYTFTRPVSFTASVSYIGVNNSEISIELKNSGGSAILESRDSSATNGVTNVSMVHTAQAGDYLVVKSSQVPNNQLQNNFSVKAQVTSENLITTVKNGFIEEKILGSPIITAGGSDISALQFDNLVVGRRYFISGAVRALVRGSNTASFSYYSGAGGTGTLYGRVSLTDDATSDMAIGTAMAFSFVAVSDTAYFRFTNSSGTTTLSGNGGKDQTFIQLHDYTGEFLSAVPVEQVAYLKDVKSSGTNGGTFTSGAWQTRTLNTVTGDNFVSLSSNQFTLTKGKYVIKAKAPAYNVQTHKVKVYNITDSADEIIGSSERTETTDSSFSLAEGVIEITVPTTFEIQHRCSTTNATFGFGINNGFGVDEVYTQVEIRKLK